MKTAWILATLLLLSGCTPTLLKPVPDPSTPVSTSSVPEEPEAPDSSSDASGAPEEQPEEPSSLPDAQPPASAGSSVKGEPAVELPVPDGMPPAASDALKLPAQYVWSEAGYGLELLTPVQYEPGHWDPDSRGGPRGFWTGDFFLLQQGGKSAVANANGALLTGFDLDYNDPRWLSKDGMAEIFRNGKAGIIDVRDGSMVIPCAYQAVRPRGHSLFEATVDPDLTLLLDREGNTVFEMERSDSCYLIPGDNILALQQEGMLRLYRMDDYTPVNNCSCEKLTLLRESREGERALLGIYTTGAWGICDSEGNEIVEPLYDDIGYFQGDYADFTLNGKMGVIRYDGEVVVKPEWEDLIVYEDCASVCKQGRWGMITDLDNSELGIELAYDFVGAYGKGDYAVFERNNKFGLLDRAGNEIIPPHYDNMIYQSDRLATGYYLVQGNRPFSYGIVHDGKVVLTDNHDLVLSPLNGAAAEEEPYLLVCNPREQWGYLDKTGKFVIDTRFDRADEFIAGRDVAFVSLEGEICLIDRDGHLVLETVFTDLICYHPETMVGMFAYPNPADPEEQKVCLARVIFPE